MELEFNKPNLVYLLLVIHQERKNGIFFENLRAELKRAIASGGDIYVPPAPSRATWFNYFRDFDEVWPDGFPRDQALKLALDFIRDHPKRADKYYRKFCRTTFICMRDFLIQNGYIGGSPLGALVSDVPGSLYFSLISFLGPNVKPEGDHISLPGTYRVYRPSLSSPGKVLVSAARISSRTDGTLHYEERMHFRADHGWREQHLEGYAIGTEGKAFLITKDDNTRLLQFFVLKPLVRGRISDGRTVIQLLAGSYTGSSHTRENGLFSTGIVMVRENFRTVDRHPVQRWKLGHVSTFGLQKREDVPEQIIRHLFE